MIYRKRKESDIQLSILHYLRSCGHVAAKTKTMGVKRGKVFCFDPWTFRGFPDITGFMVNGNKPQIFFIEVKGDKGVQSQEQKNFQYYCKLCGIIYILARCVDDVEKTFKNVF